MVFEYCAFTPTPLPGTIAPDPIEDAPWRVWAGLAPDDLWHAIFPAVLNPRLNSCYPIGWMLA